MGWAMDASLALAWTLPDERSGVADRFFRLLTADEVRVPALFWYEITSAVTASVRRGRMTPASGERVLHLVSQLPIKTDAGVGQTCITPIGAVAREQGISAYDAAYLELAMRLGLGMATLDDRLGEAARRLGVPVFE